MKQENINIFYRDMRKDYPLMERAEGLYLYDSEGRKYIDGVAGIAVVNIGHGVKEVIDAMYRQAKKACFIFAGQFTTEAQLNLAENLVQLSPPGSIKSFLCLRRCRSN